MNILMVTDELPRESGAAGPSRYLYLIEDLSREHRIFLVCFAPSPVDTAQVLALKKLCAQVEVIPLGRLRRWGHPLRLFFAMLRGEPPFNGYYASGRMRRSIRRLCRDNEIDIVHVEHAHMASYLRCTKGRKLPKSVLVLHNVGPVMFERIAAIEDRPLREIEFLLSSLFSRRWEPRACRRFDRCLVFSDVDRAHLLSRGRGIDVAVTRYGFKPRTFPFLPPPTSTEEILFIGKMTYPPNRDGVRHFCSHILPLILERRPGVRLHVGGASPPKHLDRFVPAAAVDLVGTVTDPWRLYARCALSVVPLRAGSGVRGKILESMALGRPVVTTSMGCEGLEVRHGEHLLIADSAEEFAQCVLRLLSDRSLWGEIVAKARRFMEANHRWDEIAGRTSRLYQELAGRA
jgi:glycosyltransferase involved in cell wall biosynthesis